ncbi:Putative uncharacterized protein [Lactococcus lactis subsp. lactis A12]|uniref:Uncharacterized protein n=1 Tax=Lactococcus lactis subsp. lactis A12 TaxID=1137134 RepID=S6F6P2_LACLL|nr:Putative uncharacterized protein [Lactococcus lactis subsp. lactis A12]
MYLLVALYPQNGKKLTLMKYQPCKTVTHSKAKTTFLMEYE